MTDVQIYAGTLEASANDRTATGLLVPFGEDCSSNLGRFRVDTGAFTIPQDLTGLGLNVEHERERVVGGITKLDQTDKGIVATFKFADTPEGNQALADARSGKRSKLSAEVRDVVISAGKAVAGAVFGSALVKSGAFPSATLLAAAPDVAGAESETPADVVEKFTDEITEDGVTRKRTTTRTTHVENGVTTITERIVIEEPEPPAEGATPVATAPNTLTAGKTSGKGEVKTGPDLREVAFIMDAVAAGRADSTLLARLEGQFHNQSTLFAALNDVKYDAAGSPVPYNPAPQWLGELYAGVEYEQVYAPLIGHGDLTSKKLTAFRWVVKPAGGTWGGNKTNIPSNTPTTEPYEVTADIFAGGHDHAIEHKLFNSPGYFEAYWKAMTESYKRWVDQLVLTELITEATTAKADNPAGLTIGAGMSAVVDGATAVIDSGAIPTFAVINSTLYKSILKTPQNQVLGYLNAALGLENGTLEGSGFAFKPAKSLPTGNVLVGAKQAATLHELPGVPVRVEAPDTVKGGVDTNLFGAAAVAMHKANALQLITPYTA